MASTLTHTVHCPNCGRPVAASLAHVGQRVACPSCRGEFLLSPTALLAPSSTATKSAGSTGSVSASAVGAPPAPPPQRPVAPPPAPPPRSAPDDSSYNLAPPLPPPAPNTAQFLAAKPQAAAIAPQADGKLPTLQLADSPDAAGKAGSEASPVPLWAALLAVAASTAVSLILLLGIDLEGVQSAESIKVQARQDLARFYETGVGLPKPYQLQLREGQLANSRGDRRAEREHYRKVLAQLRVEGRSKFQPLTGTLEGDKELDRILSILLAD